MERQKLDLKQENTNPVYVNFMSWQRFENLVMQFTRTLTEYEHIQAVTVSDDGIDIHIQKKP